MVIAETRTDTYIAEQHQQFGVDEVDFIHSYGIEIGKPTIIHNLEYPKLINFEKNELPSVTNTRGLVNPVLKNNKTYITYYTLTQLLNNTENYRNTKYVVYDKNGKFIFGSDLDKTEMVSFSFDKFSHKVIEPTPQPIPEYHSDDETMACYDVINDMELSFEKNGYIVRENYFTDKCEDQTWKTWNGIGTVCSIYLYTDGDYRVTFIAMPNIGDKQQVITARMKKQANGKYLIDSFYTTHLPVDKGVFVSEETGQPYSADTVNEGLE